MTAAIQQRRSPLGLFSDKAPPRPYEHIVEELCGCMDVRTMMIDTHILNRGGRSQAPPA